MPSEPVNGMSVEAIHDAVSRAADRARRGEGPTLLEFRTYRYKGHSMSDPGKYRTKEEVEEYKHRDPLDATRAILIEQKWATEAELDALDEQIKARVQQSVDFAEASPYPAPEEIYKEVYVEDYPFIID